MVDPAIRNPPIWIDTTRHVPCWENISVPPASTSSSSTPWLWNRSSFLSSPTSFLTQYKLVMSPNLIPMATRLTAQTEVVNSLNKPFLKQCLHCEYNPANLLETASNQKCEDRILSDVAPLQWHSLKEAYYFLERQNHRTWEPYSTHPSDILPYTLKQNCLPKLKCA